MRSDEQWNTITAALYWAVIGGLCWFCIRYVFFWLLPFLFGAAIATLLRPAALQLLDLSLNLGVALHLLILFLNLLLAHFHLPLIFPPLVVKIQSGQRHKGDDNAKHHPLGLIGQMTAGGGDIRRPDGSGAAQGQQQRQGEGQYPPAGGDR